MENLAELVADNEEWLMDRILVYSKKHGYSKYTSTLADAWRLSINGLSGTLIKAILEGAEIPELSPEQDWANDAISRFGVMEAEKHRARGVTLGMFLGLMKYYRQTYLDLVLEEGLDRDEEKKALFFLQKFFDRIELGFCSQWNGLKSNGLVCELQEKNRNLTNEKNKFLTVFESIREPVLLLDEKHRIQHTNHAWHETFIGQDGKRGSYYSGKRDSMEMRWLVAELQMLGAHDELESALEKDLPTSGGMRRFRVEIRRLLDVSEKFGGAVATFHDITVRKVAEEALEQRLRSEAGLSRCSHALLDEKGNALMIALEHLLNAFQADRICVFENIYPGREGVYVRLAEGVVAGENVRRIGASPETRAFPEGGFDRWRKAFRNGQVIAGVVTGFPEDEKQVLLDRGILEIAAIPLVAAGVPYGFISYENTDRVRDWDGQDLVAMETAAGMIGAYFGREQALGMAKAFLNTPTDVAVILDRKGVVLDLNKTMAAFFNSSRQKMRYRPVWEFLTEEESRLKKRCLEEVFEHREAIRFEDELKGTWHDTVIHPIFDISGNVNRAAVVSRDISKRKKNEKEVEKSRDVLASQARELAETNTALNVLLRRSEQEKQEQEKSMRCTLEKLVLPYIDKLKQSRFSGSGRTYIEIIESNLQHVCSSFAKDMASSPVGLTPAQIQVVDLVKEGKSTKEIARALNISENAVSFHRKSIRKKLGISNTSVNLQSFLKARFSGQPSG